MAGGPGGVLAPTCPVSLRLRSQRLIEGKEIPKILATSLRAIPRSTASSTFTLRSSEYALMQDSFVEDQVLRKPLSGRGFRRGHDFAQGLEPGVQLVERGVESCCLVGVWAVYGSPHHLRPEGQQLLESVGDL